MHRRGQAPAGTPRHEQTSATSGLILPAPSAAQSNGAAVRATAVDGWCCGSICDLLGRWVAGTSSLSMEIRGGGEIHRSRVHRCRGVLGGEPVRALTRAREARTARASPPCPRVAQASTARACSDVDYWPGRSGSSVRLMTLSACSIRGAARPAISFGRKSAIHTNTLRSAPSANT